MSKFHGNYTEMQDETYRKYIVVTYQTAKQIGENNAPLG